MQIGVTASAELLHDVNRLSGGNVDLQVKLLPTLMLSLRCKVCEDREEIAMSTPLTYVHDRCRHHFHKESRTIPVVAETVELVSNVSTRRIKDMDND